MSRPATLKQAQIGPVSAELTAPRAISRAVPSMSQLLRRLWTSPEKPPADAVVIHDPDARRPHDLDDPFFDRQVQSRMAETIAQARRKS